MSTAAVPVDPAFADLLADPRNTIRVPPAHVSMTRVRAAADAAMTGTPGPDLFAVEDLEAPGPAGPLPLRLYRPSAARDLPAIVFAHGGGFVMGSLDTHDAMCRSLAVKSGCAVVSVGYRLAPEARYPAAIDDVVAALAWVLAEAGTLGLDADRVALCGDSAGAYLAASAALRVPRLRHVALIYPLLDPSCDTPSAHALSVGYVLTREAMLWFWNCFLGEGNAGIARLGDDVARLPPVTIVTAGYDPLSDEGEAFAEQLRAANVDVTAHHYPGMIHGFVGMPHLTPIADRAIDDVARDLRDALVA